MATWLILDSDYLCHRAYHAMGGLSHDDMPVGVIYGFLRDIGTFQDLFDTPNVVFCFSYGQGLREQAVPSYKAPRRAAYEKLTPEELDGVAAFRQQVADLRRYWLSRLGYVNVFYSPGYEADDVIASVVQSSLGPDDDAVIVSSDKDLYQLISPRVVNYNPQTRKTITLQSFHKTYGVAVSQWAEVKALAGCKSDNVLGVRGVGEKTAIKYIRGELRADSKTYAAIRAQRQNWRANLPLVQLPYPGCPTYTLGLDDACPARWQRVADYLGFRSIRDKPPQGDRAARKQIRVRRQGRGEGFGIRA